MYLFIRCSLNVLPPPVKTIHPNGEMPADLVDCRTYTSPAPPELQKTILGGQTPGRSISRSILPIQISLPSHYPTLAEFGVPNDD